MLAVIERVAIRQSKNTRLELRDTAIGIRAAKIGSHLARLLPRRSLVSLLVFFTAAILQGFPAMKGNAFVHQENTADGTADEQTHPYLEDTPKQLVKHVPELKGLRPAADQQELAMILGKTADRVDEFFSNVVDLVAHEEIRQERNGYSSRARAVKDNYLIVHHGNGGEPIFDEFRMDENGNRVAEVGTQRGFLVTSGFALICVHFSLEFRRDSQFRYLGEQRIHKRDAYVVAFAQLPKAQLTVTMTGPRGIAVKMLTQGVAWIDKEDFRIIRMRTDLLAPHREIGLDVDTTKVNFGEVLLADVPAPLWLPREVEVYVKLGEAEGRFEERFRNVHRYSDYRRYRVSTKIVNPAVNQ
jgi:hypothetical protein